MRLGLRHALVVAVALCAALPTGASAHATLESSVPASAAQLARPPDQIVFRFDEPVSAREDAVKVFDAHGHRVQVGAASHPGGRGDEIAARLPGQLPQGGYTATYRVLSDDGHVVSGGLTFAIGRGAAALAPGELLEGQTAGAVTATAAAVARGVQYAAIALAVGLLLFVWLAWLPGLAEVAGGADAWRGASEAFSARLRTMLGAAAAAGVVSGVAALVLEAAQIDGTSAWAAARPDALDSVLHTRFGAAWLSAIQVWAVLAAALAAGRGAVPVLRPATVGATGVALQRRDPRRFALALPAAVLVVLPALAGHASVKSPVALMLPANVVHVVGMSAWLGGIAALVLALPVAASRLEAIDRSRLLVAVIARFSTVALAAVAALGLTGTLMAIVELRDLSELATTAFGRSVAAKALLFGVLVGLGFANRNRLLPALQASTTPGQAWSTLRRTLRAELAVGVAALAITGALAGYSPTPVDASGRVSREADVGPAHLRATLAPAHVGSNRLELYLSRRGSPARFTAAKAVTVEAALQSTAVATLSFDARSTTPGEWTADVTLGVPGTWDVTVTVRVSDFDEYTTRLALPVS